MFTFYAKTNKVFVKSLENELKLLGVQSDSIINLNKQRLNYLKFKCTSKSLWNVMLYSRLIEGLHIQIKESFSAK
jgi:hypothetical protein